MKAEPVCCCEVHPELGLGLEFNESGPPGRLAVAAPHPSESTSMRLGGTTTAPGATDAAADGGGFVQGGRSRLA